MPTDQKITATFSEAMNAATILVPGTFTVTGPGATPISGTVTYDAVNNIAIFAPIAGTFAASTTFTATITTAALSFPGSLPLASNYIWTFKSGASLDTSTPLVLSTNPVDLSSIAATNQKITATFNEAIDSTTINVSTFTLTGPGATPVLGTTTYATSAASATFIPSSDLLAATVYTASLSTAVKDLAGNALATAFTWSFTTGAGTNFAAFAEATITNVVSAGTLINGDLGLTPGTSVTGFPPGTVNGTKQIANPPAVAALTDLGTAYGIAAGLSGATTISENLANQILPPDLYKSNAADNSFEITGANLTLDAQGDPNAVWVFQMPASTLTLTTGSCNVILVNGAQAQNIFWQVGSSATIGAGCILEGSILANTSITLNSGATVNGRSLAGAVTATGAQTMDSNKVNLPVCN
jgi:methionine-rich copper-binding protein CopC